MNRLKSHQLDRILNNKTSGSSELVQILNSFFLSIHKNKSEILRSIRLVKARLGHFEAVSSYLKDLSSELKTGHGLLKFLRIHTLQQKEKVEIIFNKIYSHLKKISSIITLSRSGTVFEILKLWQKKNKNIRVAVCESRPEFEGRLMAQALARAGIKTELITDAMIAIYSRKVDAAIIGADTILKNGNVVNKVGSKSLALLCKEYEKPFFVVSTKSKISSSNKFQPENEDTKEVFNKKIKNLSVSNIYFEEIEKKFITKIFTS